jgi:transposase
LVKEKLRFAYEADTKLKMKRRIDAIISLCYGTDNEHFIWFANLLRNHYSGIISHATYRISTGRVEGINQMIKTLRRKSYGIPDDEYFFLKIMDASRK